MLKELKRLILFSTFSLLIICPAASFAWNNYAGNGDGYWNYHGSGRDYSYSDYIDAYYNPGYIDYPSPDYMDEASYFKNVPPPVILPAPAEFTVNIPNAHGGYTAVVIKRSGNGYIGPQGEYYPEFPKIFQLEIMYGK